MKCKSTNFRRASFSATSPLARWLVVCALLTTPIPPAPAQGIYSQAYTFSTFAGQASTGSADGVGTDAQFNFPFGIAVDSAGNVYVADTSNATIRKITPGGVVTTLAGLANAEGQTDGTGSAARFGEPGSVAADSAGNVYVADLLSYEIRKVTPAGVVTTLVPSGTLFLPSSVTVDKAGNLYVADTDHHIIRKVTPAGVVTTLAGLLGTSGTNDGTGGAARFNRPSGVTVDTATNVYVADTSNQTIRKVTPAGIVTTLAGFAGSIGASDGTGTNARFSYPNDVAVDNAGNVFVADTDNETIRKITPAGVVTTLAGQGGTVGHADGTGNAATFNFPFGLAVDSATNVYVADTRNSAIREITTAGRVTTLAGSTTSQGSTDGAGTGARFSKPQGVATDTNGNVYVADTYNFTIREITPAGAVNTIAGSPGNLGTNDGVGANARFGTHIPFNGSTSSLGPQGLVVDSAGNIYIADSGNNTIRKIIPPGTVTTIAGVPLFDGGGNPIGGSADGTNTTARFNDPWGLAADRAGNIYVADSGNNTIRKITQNGSNFVVTTVAGLAGSSGAVDGTNSVARFYHPSAVALDTNGNIYVADAYNYTIRQIRPLAGTNNWAVTTIAGAAGVSGYLDGVGTNAHFSGYALANEGPSGLTVDLAGNIYVSDSLSTAIRKIVLTGTNWVVSTIGGPGSGSADGSGSAALFQYPMGMSVDNTGNLYVADTPNNTIRKGIFTQLGVANPVTYSHPAMNGALQVTLLPPQANGQWRFPWEVTWHNSGFTATGLAAGNYPVEFRSLSGWLAIPSSLTTTNPAAVAASGVSQVTNNYYPTALPSDANTAAGSLTVYLGANPPSGAGWRFLGDTTPYLPSNLTTNLLPGTYLIQFAGPFSGRSTPPNASVQVFASLPTLINAPYPEAATPPAGVLFPAPVTAGEISDVVDYPFGFNGQLQTDVGFGSGVVVKSNVVLTAAHLVFDDEALAYVSGAYWFLQQEVPSYTPSPVPARGWYLLAGYAAQRTNDLSSGTYGVDVSSAQSRNLDVAALYFTGPVAGGGFGGYLPSDQVPNQWLTSSAEKMLVGYPVDGSLYGFTTIVPGTMYEIGPQPYALTLDAETVTNQQQVYLASWFLSFPGNSGGPLYVQLNGYYYPAGVYLGTLNGQSVVRAIDGAVTNLITLAATQGDDGTNHSGGGVVTIVPGPLSVGNPGYLQIQLAPPSAVQAGAAWLLLPGTTYSTSTNFTQAIFSTSPVTLQFKPIPGWNLPTNQSVTVSPGGISTPTAFYTVLRPNLVFNAQGIGLSGTTNTTYRIEKTTSLKNPVWTGLSTNTITSSNFTLVVPKTTNSAATFYRAVWLNR